jgi:hypothetical protein
VWEEKYNVQMNYVIPRVSVLPGWQNEENCSDLAYSTRFFGVEVAPVCKLIKHYPMKTYEGAVA